MVPAERIILEAINNKVDIIGLSGLITPSLDEMAHVAKEMEKHKMTIPLMIGGAATSKIHTAVKIAPNYSQPVVYGRDASKCAGIAGNLFSEKDREEFVSSINIEYENIRKEHNLNNLRGNNISFQEANRNRFVPDPGTKAISKPPILGNEYLLNYPLEEISKYIDWTFFFHEWRMSGRYPDIFKDKEKGPEAKKLFDDAQKLLDQIIKNNLLVANAAFGIYPANSAGNDVFVYADEQRKDTIARFTFLRNQEKKEEGTPNLCLSDFFSPAGSNIIDYIGFFAITAGLGIEKSIKEFEDKNDDYNSIMMKILADRLAEAFTELLHLRVRKEFWGYDKDENLLMEDILREKYLGIRPAPGYPCCPVHNDKRAIFDVLDAENKINIMLTDNFAMLPAASVCGWYIANPGSKYFNLGKISRDQVFDFAKRNDISLADAEKRLGTNLNY